MGCGTYFNSSVYYAIISDEYIPLISGGEENKEGDSTLLRVDLEHASHLPVHSMFAQILTVTHQNLIFLVHWIN